MESLDQGDNRAILGLKVMKDPEDSQELLGLSDFRWKTLILLLDLCNSFLFQFVWLFQINFTFILSITEVVNAIVKS